MMRTLVTTMAIMIATAATTPADYTRHFAPWPVTVNGDTLTAPFWGGINNPKPSLVDFNTDGAVDLMLGDTEGRLGYFRNNGDGSVTPVSERLGGVDIGTWHLLVDLDNDNDLDLLCDSRTGRIEYHRNDGGGDADPQFTLIDTAWFGLTLGFNNTPAFADIDADGDLDLFFGATSGALELYENVGTAESASLELASTFYDSVLAFPGAGDKDATDPHHGFSVLSFTDIDDDNDLDLFWGDAFNRNLYLFENLGDSAVSDLTWVTENYLTEPTKGFNHPRFADVDGDGDRDMILGVANAASIDNLHFLRNLGTPDQAFFSTETQNAIENIDIGAYSQPTFGDLDNDGDKDLVLGGGDGVLQLFRNTGGATAPSFELIVDTLAGIDVGLNAAPTLVDWDHDGDLDLLVGTQQGRIQFWRNDGTPEIYDFVLEDPELAGLKVDQFAVPRAADLNGDSLADLIVGEWDFNSFANVLLLHNTGSWQEPALTLVTSMLLPRQSREYTVPALVDWDRNGTLDIVVGGRSSGLTIFSNNAAAGSFPDSTTLVPVVDTVPGSDLGTYLAACFVDIDGDYDLDIFLGEEDGGLTFFEKDGTCCVGERGNANADVSDEINVTDLVFLVDFVFRGGRTPVCPPEADTNADGSINVADLTMLVSRIFIGLDNLPTCP